LGVLIIAVPRVGTAQDNDPSAARALFLECQELFAADNPCKAAERCREGLMAAELPALVELEGQARKACSKKRTTSTAKKPSCPEGQSITDDTDGHCCWAGQVWSEEQCVGRPTECPAGYEVTAASCRLQECREGQERIDDLYCCWPGQVWSSTRAECVGTPTCPGGTVPTDDEDCVPDGDSDGVLDIDDLCIDVPEDPDGFEDEDGCPDLDNDGDGIADANDDCPLERELMNALDDDDGCPEADRDEDGILDDADLCPDIRGMAEHSGCPPNILAREPSRPPPSQALFFGGLASIGVGTALLGTGIALSVYAGSERDKVRNARTNGQGAITSLTEVEAKAIEDRTNTIDAVAITTLSLGGVGLVAGAVMLIVDALGEETQTDNQVDGAVIWSDDGAMLMFRHTF